MTPRLPAAALCAVLSCLSLPARAADPPPDPALIGLWSTRVEFGPEVRGRLRVTRAGAAGRAAIAGHEVPFTVRRDSVRFTLPGGRGGFRGAFHGGGLRGFWIQPSGATADRRDPGGTGQRFATPVSFRRERPGVWSGEVRPLADRFTLHLKVYPWINDWVVGALRNPELNLTGGASRYRVIQEGDSVFFCLRPDTTHPWTRYVRGSYDRARDVIRLAWPELGRSLELTRRTPESLPGFFPRHPDTAYAYRRPPATGDGWDTAAAGETGMDEARLAELVRDLIRVDPAQRLPPLIHSLLVAHRGRLVLEEYFYGHGRDSVHDIRSAGKTLGSVMVGAAMAEGRAIGPETRIYDLLAANGPFAHPDPRKSRITLEHLLTHTSGLACDDNDGSSPGNEGVMQSQPDQPDWWRYTLDLPVRHEPGTRYAYCSANSNLVGAALTAVTGEWLPAFFERTIAAPLGFGPWHWNLMPTGDGYLGGGAFLRPRDLLKVGQVFLDGGRWRGRRIVDPAWIGRSTREAVAITPATTGLDSTAFPEFYGGGGRDGLAWHLNDYEAAGRRVPAFDASGNGGQLLIVVPALELAVVFTAGNYMQGGIWNGFRRGIVEERIIPAIGARPPRGERGGSGARPR